MERQIHLKAGNCLEFRPDENQVKLNIINKTKSILTKISPDLKVLNGPFKGLVYPSHDISESTLLPKIVGSYEAHLHTIINNIITVPYSDIINIGCAEGYYAVGLASKMPDTIIHCFDINERDISFCKEMAKFNKVKNLTYNSICSHATLRNFSIKGRGLILCDCEGCELELFSPDVITYLKNMDILVELHDVINPIISAEMVTRFQYTHHIQIINNINVDISRFAGLEKLSEEERVFSFLEHRGGFHKNIFMEWAFFTNKEEN